MVPGFINLAERLAARRGVSFDDELRLAKRERAALDGVGVVREFNTNRLDGVRENPSGVLLLAVLDVDRFHIPKRWCHGFGKAAERLGRLWQVVFHARHFWIAQCLARVGYEFYDSIYHGPHKTSPFEPGGETRVVAISPGRRENSDIACVQERRQLDSRIRVQLPVKPRARRWRISRRIVHSVGTPWNRPAPGLRPCRTCAGPATAASAVVPPARGKARRPVRAAPVAGLALVAIGAAAAVLYPIVREQLERGRMPTAARVAASPTAAPRALHTCRPRRIHPSAASCGCSRSNPAAR